INAALAAAIAAVPSNTKRYWVNQISGDDTAAGTAEAPLKTIIQALSRTPSGGLVTIHLQADYVMDSRITIENRRMYIETDKEGVKRKIKAGYYKTADGVATYMAGFLLRGGEALLTYTQVELPSQAGLVPVPAGMRNSFFTADVQGGSVAASVKLSSSEVISAADSSACLIGATQSAVVLQVIDTIFPANFGGRYVFGVSAGTNA
ncbi:hypothetical protein G7007_21925, partial [Pseudomonas entomophila]|uniref:hypothetical protein n=1 Tax=Pseudomonas entomophila TaxID=312306 RepID=UPI0015E37DED